MYQPKLYLDKDIVKYVFLDVTGRSIYDTSHNPNGYEQKR